MRSHRAGLRQVFLFKNMKAPLAKVRGLKERCASMLRAVALLGISPLTLVAASVVGCSSSKSSGSSGEQVDCVAGAGGCPVCTGPGADASTAVSFAADIQPIFQGSCGVSGPTCHGQFGGGSAQNLYLAEPMVSDDGYGDAGAILEGIVRMTSLEAPTMDIVTPGDPSSSYLMHKVNGDMCAIISDCAPITASLPSSITMPCGVRMPQTGAPLGPSEATLIWDWIEQGAKNN